MASDEETMFNSSLKTSDYVRESCVNAGKFLMNRNTYRDCHHLLWMLNNEISGWYAKKNSKAEFFKDLEELENKADQASVNLNSGQAFAVYKITLRKWTRRVVEECYKIGWLAKESENIYDSDSMLD